MEKTKIKLSVDSKFSRSFQVLMLEHKLDIWYEENVESFNLPPNGGYIARYVSERFKVQHNYKIKNQNHRSHAIRPKEFNPFIKLISYPVKSPC